ncbi:MAG: hypothetical protein JXJ22_06850 [Bacteroidales bacterium]|nr:hypothetical protein [Bacteroidales bacterium]
MKNNRFAQFFLIVTLVVFLNSCNQQGSQTADFEKVQHYRHLLFTETPWDSIKGAYKLTLEEAKTINNYKFSYDEDQRLIQVEFCRGDSLLDGSRLGAAKVAISYEDGKEIRHYFNKNNEPQTVNGDVFKAVYDLDETGFRTGLKFYGKDDQPVENRNNIGYYTWSKTPLGMIKENRYTLAGEETVLNPFCPFYELRFSYNEKGIVTRMANYEKDMLYDCTAENCGNIGVSYFDFTINDEGGLLGFSVHSTTGQLSNLYWGWARFTQSLDENGYVTERVNYDQDDELLGGKMVPIVEYSYDESGSLVEEKNLDASRQLMNNNDGIAIRKYKYDEYGNRIETVSLDKDMVEVKS